MTFKVWMGNGNGNGLGSEALTCQRHKAWPPVSAIPCHRASPRTGGPSWIIIIAEDIL